MRSIIAIAILSILTPKFTSAQTLFSYGGHEVSVQEFKRVYEKNNIQKKVDYSASAINDYLKLYSLFKMKVKEAEALHLDTVVAISRELDNYRKQLAKNYLTDAEVTNRLVVETYNRMKEEIKVAHILVSVLNSATPEDTLKAYKKVDSIYNALMGKKKADFAATAKVLSDDKGSATSGGEIGYITALQTIYSFENVAYATPLGAISKPFRSIFGYHIVKVLDRRPTQGEIQVAQILLATPKSKGEDGVREANVKADSIVNALKAGADFAAMVQTFSEDKYSIKDNGVLAPFSAGKMVPAFENAAFALKNIGDIAAPVQTEYGIHIIKLINKTPLKPLDSLRDVLKRKVENDSRGTYARESYMNKVKSANGFKEYAVNVDEVINALNKIVDTGKNANSFQATNYTSMTKPVFELASKTYSQHDLISYIEMITRGRLNGPKNAVVRDIYTMYANAIVNDFQEHKLVEDNADFRVLMQEYKDGVYLFELMDRMVWSKASKDSLGLELFYKDMPNKYTWAPGFSGTLYKFDSLSNANKALAILKKKNTTDEDIVKAVNTEVNPNAVIIQTSTFEFDKYAFIPKDQILSGKLTKIFNNDGKYYIIKTKTRFDAPQAKTLNESRGYVVAAYQDYLEKQWNESLRAKYPMQINESVLQSLIK